MALKCCAFFAANKTFPACSETCRMKLDLGPKHSRNRARAVEANRPGPAGCHELLDRTALLVDLLERHVLGHHACVAYADWYRLAEQAAAKLRDLYQQVAAEHLAEEE